MPNPARLPRVVLTRPKDQALPFARLLEQAGIQTFLFPTLSIAFLQPKDIYSTTETLLQADYIIFLSHNAVQGALPLWPSPKPSALLLAVGEATANSLAKAGLGNALYPQNPSSLAVIQMPCLQQVRNKKIVIISGMHPTEIIQKELKKRGAQVSPLFTYSRVCPQYPCKTLQELIYFQPDFIVTQSKEALKNLYHLLSKHHIDWLLTQNLLVINESSWLLAQKIGFQQQIVLSPNAMSHTVYQQLKDKLF